MIGITAYNLSMSKDRFIKRFPLFKGSSLEVGRPTIDYFINRIKNKDYFSLVRFQIEYWKMVRIALQSMGYPGLSAPKILKKDSQFAEKLGSAMLRTFDNVQEVNGDRPWEFSERVFADHIKMIISNKPNNFFLSVSDKSVYLKDNTPDVGNKWMADLIKELIPDSEVPLLSTIWRRWAQNGEIQRLMDLCKDRAVVVVGPYYYEKFGKKLGFNNCHYVRIDLFKACLQVHETYINIKKLHNKLLKTNDDVIYLFAGGSAGAWLIDKLHNQIPRAFMIEFGRALDVYFYNDPVRWKSEKWVFGYWMDKRPPTWLKGR